MFSTEDSREYLAVSDELFSWHKRGHSLTRPFLYPLLILLVYQPLGIVGLWALQFFFWLGAVNLLYLSIKKITGQWLLGVAGSLTFVCNLSAIALTLHGLTELTCIFLLALFSSFVCYNYQRARTLRFAHSCLFLLALLCALKPVFSGMLYVALIVFPFFYSKHYADRPSKLGYLLLALMPLLIQLSIMRAKYGEFFVSKIGSFTFMNFIFSRGIMVNEAVTWEEARVKANTYTNSEVMERLSRNKMLYLGVFGKNLQENMKASPAYLLFPAGYSHPRMAAYMYRVNALYYYGHLLFALPLLALLYYLYKKRQGRYFVPLFSTGLLTWYILLSSGISFAQGDRLVIPALPCFILMYAIILGYLHQTWKNR